MAAVDRRHLIGPVEPAPDAQSPPSLGPISIGAVVITPPPGLQEWQAEIDLRPAQDEVVSLHGRVDPSTGVAEWTITTGATGE